jgi:hypothetical protein
MRAVAISIVAVVASVCAQASSAGQAPTVLVTYEQTGGFAGIERGLVVYRTGRVQSDGLPLKASRLTPARLSALKTALRQARFATLAKRYESETPIADGFIYRVTYGGRSVRVEEGADPPARLERVLVQLRSLTHA